MVQLRYEYEATSSYVVDLRDHHCQCEINFFMMMKMLPGCREGTTKWSYAIGAAKVSQVQINLLDFAPYTSTIEITQNHKTKPYIDSPKILVRLYHDVEMAEIVAWDKDRHWLPVYDYPNEKMYQTDEKLVLNRFLGEWLAHCREQGIFVDNVDAHKTSE